MARAAQALTGLSPDVVAGYLAAPESQVAEVLEGELSLQARPRRRHTRAASRLGMSLGSPFDIGSGGPGGWVLLFEPELWLGPRPDIVVPDLAGWRRERMPNALEDEAGEAHYETAPDWVCEVVSTSTEAIDRGKKRRIYRREKVDYLWLLLPESRTLEVYRLEGDAWREEQTYEEPAMVRVPPFEAIELDLALLWAS